MKKPFSSLAAVLLALIMVAQFTRFFMRWIITVNGVVIPIWLSGIAGVVTGVLAVMVWMEARY